MSKKRKTRQEKKIAELRHKLTASRISPTQTFEKNNDNEKEDLEEKKSIFTYKSQESQTPQFSKPSESLVNLSYVTKDLRKTAFLTGTIIAFEIILFIFFKNKFINIPLLNF